MGSPRSEKRREGGANNQIERLHRTRIERIFALGTHEVTVQEFLRFRKDHPYNRTYTPGGDFPMMGVSWYDMAAYCNWLSEREGLPREQWCYHPNAEGKYAPGMYVNPHYLTLQGYRLPTEAEWEYACRAGTQTSSYHGSTSDQLGRYVWFGQGGADRTRAVGQMCPNDWGLFDMLGNVGECTQDGLTAYTVPDTGLSSLDSERLDPVDAGTIRVFRGGSFVDSPLDIRSARRYRTLAGSRGGAVGFRVARTIVPTPHPERQQVIDQLLPLLDQPGDGIKGKMVFQTQCVRCHTHANTGTALGPDLMLLRGWSKQEILVHLIDPSRQMADRYRVYQATTREGRSIQGILTTETPLAVELTDAEGAHHLIQRDDLVQLVITPASLMPEDFEKRLKEQELIDLLAFLTQPGKFVPLPLDRVATAISTKTLFNSGENKIERMIFPDWSPKKIAEVPFVLVDPRDNRVPNIVLLHSPLNAITASRPKSVRLPCPTSARAIHLLSGVSGRGYPVTEKGTLTLTIRLHYADGSTEHHDLINGVHFADYQGRMNVPGSRFALALGGNQIRFLSILPRRHDRIEAIEFLKGTDGTAPMVLAVTLEMP